MRNNSVCTISHGVVLGEVGIVIFPMPNPNHFHLSAITNHVVALELSAKSLPLLPTARPVLEALKIELRHTFGRRGSGPFLSEGSL